MKSEKNAAFTLIELLVVVLIIGILAAIAMPQYQVAVAKARYTQNIILVKAVYEAQQRYFMANGVYADHFDSLDISLPSDGKVEQDANGKEAVRFKDRSYIRLNYYGRVYMAQPIKGGSGDVVAYYGYFDRSRTPECAAYSYHDDGSRTDLANRVCQSLGGKFVREEDCRSDGSTCYYYSLP